MLWKELGLNKNDLDEIEAMVPGWSEQMLTVAAAKMKAEADRMNEAAQAQPQAPMAKGLGGTGKKVIRNKLL